MNGSNENNEDVKLLLESQQKIWLDMMMASIEENESCEIKIKYDHKTGIMHHEYKITEYVPKGDS